LARNAENYLCLFPFGRQDGCTTFGRGKEFHANPQSRSGHLGWLMGVFELGMKSPNAPEEGELEFQRHGRPGFRSFTARSVHERGLGTALT
jgi:hypothetical protein